MQDKDRIRALEGEISQQILEVEAAKSQVVLERRRAEETILRQTEQVC